ncbi:hypothetical protein ABZ635_22025 [Nocardiopsis sp. NPDC007018]|uniref:hypothetical protein n=1 Tax=Nocardiopsis sp. NPDC007018 TaxID=3155721 RepID=UPI0033D2D9A2
MDNNPQGTPAPPTKMILLGVITVGVIAAFIGYFIQNDNRDTPTVGFAAHQEQFSGPGWDAYEAGYTMSRPSFGTADIPAEVAHTDNTGTLAGALRADKANALWWCNNNMPDDLAADHPDEVEALYGGCIDGLLPDAAGSPGSYGID